MTQINLHNDDPQIIRHRKNVVAMETCTHQERQVLMTVSKYFTGITKKNTVRFQDGIRTLPSTNAYQARQHLMLL